jgi:hypothetical protein
MTSAAEAANKNKVLIAALEALRHPKTDIFPQYLRSRPSTVQLIA